MSNDEKKSKRGWWSGTKRDEEGAAAARERRARSQAERARDQVDELAAAVATELPEDGDEVDFEPIDTGITEETRRKIESDPMLQLIFQKLDNERVRRANQVSEAMGAKPPAKELQTIKSRVRIMWTILMLAITAAGGSVVAVASWLKTSGKDELQKQMLIEHDVDQERRLQQVESLLRSTVQRLEDHMIYHSRSGRPTLRIDPDARPLTPDPAPPNLAP